MSVMFARYRLRILAGEADEGASAGGENAQCRRGEVAERLKAAVC
jgi:hypothetical protein